MKSIFHGKCYLMIAVVFLLLSGCASVPMASKEQDTQAKTFTRPPSDMSAVYIFRNGLVGQALTKEVYIDGQHLGELANKTYFLKMVPPGKHVFSTQSEFDNSDLEVETKGGNNYFIRQYIKLGLIVGGANLEIVDEEGRKEVLECSLAQESHAQSRRLEGQSQAY